MRKLLLPSLIAVCGLSAYAQNEPKTELEHAKVYFSRQVDRDMGYILQDFAGEEDGELITLSAHKGVDYLKKYDVDLRESKTTEIPHESIVESKSTLTHFDFFGTKKKPAVRLYGITSKKTKTNRLFLASVDFKKVAFDQPIEIGKIEASDFNPEFDNDFVGYAFSPDSSKIVVGCKLPETKEARLGLQVFVIDAFTLETIWSKKVKLDQEGAEVRLQARPYGSQVVIDNVYQNYQRVTDGLVVDNNGVVFSWVYLDMGRGSEADRFRYSLVSISSEKVVVSPINLGSSNPCFKSDKPAAIMASGNGCSFIGAWNETGKGYAFSTSFFGVNWDGKDGGPLDPVKIDLTDEFRYGQLNSDDVEDVKKHEAKSGGTGIYDFYPTFLFSNPDGDLVLISRNDVRDRPIFGVFRLTDQFELKWQEKILLHQEFGDFFERGMSGMFFAKTADKVYSIFHDNVKNLHGPLNAGKKLEYYRPNLGKDMGAGLVTIDLSQPSDRQREKLWSADKPGGYFAPLRHGFSAVFGNHFYTYIQGGKKTERIIRVDLE